MFINYFITKIRRNSCCTAIKMSESAELKTQFVLSKARKYQVKSTGFYLNTCCRSFWGDGPGVRMLNGNRSGL